MIGLPWVTVDHECRSLKIRVSVVRFRPWPPFLFIRLRSKREIQLFFIRIPASGNTRVICADSPILRLLPGSGGAITRKSAFICRAVPVGRLIPALIGCVTVTLRVWDLYRVSAMFGALRIRKCLSLRPVKGVSVADDHCTGIRCN